MELKGKKANESLMDKFIRTKMLMGEEAFEKLQSARVAVFGVGGVGGYAVEALARGGIGAIDIIDSDCVAESNINRQLCALETTVGLPKVAVMADRMRAIHPKIKVITRQEFFLPENADSFDFSSFISKLSWK